MKYNKCYVLSVGALCFTRIIIINIIIIFIIIIIIITTIIILSFTTQNNETYNIMHLVLVNLFFKYNNYCKKWKSFVRKTRFDASFLRSY